MHSSSILSLPIIRPCLAVSPALRLEIRPAVPPVVPDLLLFVPREHLEQLVLQAGNGAAQRAGDLDEGEAAEAEDDEPLLVLAAGALAGCDGLVAEGLEGVGVRGAEFLEGGFVPDFDAVGGEVPRNHTGHGLGGWQGQGEGVEELHVECRTESRVQTFQLWYGCLFA